MKLRISYFLAFILIFYTFFPGCIHRSNKNVSYVEVKRDNILITLKVKGKIDSPTKVEVRSSAGGIINKIYFEKGDQVKKGDLLVECTPLATPLEIVRAIGDFKRAEIEYVKNKKELERYEELLKNKIITEEEYERKKTLFRLSKYEYQTATLILNSLGIKIKPSTEEMEENLKIEKGFEIRAPLTGIVIEKTAEVGTIIKPSSTFSEGTLIAVIADNTQKIFRGFLLENDLSAVKINMPVKIWVDAFSNRSFQGTLKRIIPVGIEKENRTEFEIIVNLKNSDNLMIGMSATAEIVCIEKFGVLTIDEMAIIYQNGRSYVKLLSPDIPGKVIKKEIKVGYSDGIKTEILNGLKEGDKVLIEK